ncbi:Uma2 family endonuclease [Crocosphaera sp. XPORK-15E]|uniref:Uma2 family endonuclease n=1 Tax=Crocosphaera sp. XPORK-15E TaxID=3110247 RepID=UPI002B1EFBF6|nr:Uma2 family endonuclease [Crocosphaera sp. XPORK-15E]MEA5535202.1 Uma2 family endonuclease [Crocosphaera sp. XPORK-15E]
MLLTDPKKVDSVVLYNIGWEQFENLLKDLGNTRSARIAYDDGILELMTPLPEHEYLKERISDTIKDAAEILELDYECLGSTTWKRQIKKAGIEPDNCFYFQNEPLIRGKLVFDLNHDPPPDLALEIDLTSKSINRFPIYARLEVPEIWCYDSGELKIYQLEEGGYFERENSLIFPDLKIQEIPSIIKVYRQAGRRIFRKAVREWIKKQLN